MVSTTYLQIRDTVTWRKRYSTAGDKLQLQPAAFADQCAQLHHLVGKDYCWDLDRTAWRESTWQAYFKRSDVEIDMIESRSGQVLGYCELNMHANASIEILYFGLCPDFVGQGLGRKALNLVVNRCIDLRSKHIWLHTCTLDHPAALENYYKQGFEFWKRTAGELESPVDTLNDLHLISCGAIGENAFSTTPQLSAN